MRGPDGLSLVISQLIRIYEGVKVNSVEEIGEQEKDQSLEGVKKWKTNVNLKV